MSQLLEQLEAGKYTDKRKGVQSFLAGALAPGPTCLGDTHNAKDAHFSKFSKLSPEPYKQEDKPQKLYYCKRSRFLLAGPNPEGGTSFFHAPCKSNSCPHCGRRNMGRKQARIMERLQLDAELTNDTEIFYRFITNGVKTGVLSATNEELTARVKKRLEKKRIAAGNIREKINLRRSHLAERIAHRNTVTLGKIEKISALKAFRDLAAAEGRAVASRDKELTSRRTALASYRRNTEKFCRYEQSQIARLHARRFRLLEALRRATTKLSRKRRNIIAEDAGLTPEQASRARAFRLIKSAATYGVRMTRRPRKFNAAYKRANWEGCGIEAITDVDIHPTGLRYPHCHAMHWTTRNGGPIAAMQAARRVNYLRRLKLEQHFYANNFLKNAVLAETGRWKISEAYPYQAENSWTFVHGDEQAKSTTNCVRYMAFHNGKIWRDGREYPKRYRRFSTTRNLLMPLPEKPPSEYVFVKRSVMEVTSRLLTGSDAAVMPTELAQDGTLLGASTPAPFASYRVRWALGLEHGDGTEWNTPIGERPAADIMAHMGQLQSYWESESDLQGLTFEQWQNGQLAPSLAASLEAGTDWGAAPDPFEADDPERLALVQLLTHATPADITAIMEHSRLAREQKAARVRTRGSGH